MEAETVKITRIGDIRAPDLKINVIVTCTDEEVSPHPSIRQKAMVQDTSGECEAVIWEKSYAVLDKLLETDKKYRLENVYTKEYNGTFSLSITRFTKITELEATPGGQMKLGE